MPGPQPGDSAQVSAAIEPHGRIFLRFLRFGFLAWGGPVAQIALIRQELVEEEGWVSREHFNRVLGVYQALPGPEAHELCVYFGMLAGGRVGGFLAGLGFMLPGLILMLALSWVYTAYGLGSALFQAALMGAQPAVAALIVRAVHRIGGHALHRDRWLWALAALAFLAELSGVHFSLTLLLAGTVYVLAKKGLNLPAAGLAALFAAAVLTWWAFWPGPAVPPAGATALQAGREPTPLALFISGLRSGLLTFGGAYTVIPFLRHDVVTASGWISDAQFLDGLSLSGILPAPLIIFSTFVGYLAGGLAGAAAITIGIFLPAFAFTLVGHSALERLIQRQGIHSFLDGVTAGVVGLIAATSLEIARNVITGLPSFGIFLLALAVLFAWKAKTAVVWVIAGAALTGLLLFR